MRIGDEKLLHEEVALEFDGGAVDGEAEDLENPGDDLEEADSAAGADHKGGGVTGVGVVDGNGGGGGQSGVAGGSLQRDAPASGDVRHGKRGEVCERRERREWFERK